MTSFSEWSDFRFLGLRSATCYVFVFDINCPDSFSHIKQLKDQVAESRDMRNTGVLVVGNKKDMSSDGRGGRDIAGVVRKHWKASYVEVSAKHNWNVVAVFRELLLALEEARDHHNKDARPHNLHDLHDVIEHTKCNIL